MAQTNNKEYKQAEEAYKEALKQGKKEYRAWGESVF